MSSTPTLRSPVPWMGGKHYSAKRIIEAFPTASQYDTYVDLFGGAAHVLIHKPPSKHVEIYNDINADLVTFWLQCRDNAEALEQRCRTLPYSRQVYYDYHASLYDGTDLEPLERAARWFYVLSSSFTAWVRPGSAAGWSISADHSEAHAYHSALDLFALVQHRLRNVLIDNRDFATVAARYSKPRTLLYVDPPYVEKEEYYEHSFGQADHARLAALLNSTPSYVALSYYPHPSLYDLYPPKKWRRVTWEVAKHSQRRADTRERATEMLLCNYPPAALSLWEEVSA